MIKYFDRDVHYDVLCDWFEKRGMPKPYFGMIPDSGFVDYSIDKINSMVLMYNTNSKMVFAEFLTSNPELKKQDAAMSIKRVIGAFYKHCDEKGLSCFNLCNDKKIKHVLECFGAKTVFNGLDLMIYKGELKCQES